MNQETENAEAVAATEPPLDNSNAPVETVESTPTPNDEVVESSTTQTEEVIKTENTQKRFNQLTSTIKQQQEEIDRLKRTQTLSYDENAPRPEDFATDEEFIRADAEYNATKKVVGIINRAAEQRAAEERQLSQQQKIQNYNAKVAESNIPDFQQVVAGSLLTTSVDGQTLTPAAQAILESENGPDIAVHVAKNPEIAMALNQADPVRAGMLVAQLSNQLTVSAPKINEAPPPIGSESAQSGAIPKGDPFAERFGKYEIKTS